MSLVSPTRETQRVERRPSIGGRSRLRTTAENKKRENGEDFNLHPPAAPLSHRLAAIPATCHPRPALSFAELESLATFSEGVV